MKKQKEKSPTLLTTLPESMPLKDHVLIIKDGEKIFKKKEKI